MSSTASHEQQIVNAFSAVELPEKVVNDSDIRGLVDSMRDEQRRLERHSKELDRARREKNEGNGLVNLFKNRDGQVQEAHLDLNKAMGNLTQKSSQLLIINTALSKVLSQQQRTLLEQQKVLERQTNEIRAQNEKIQDFQYQLAAQGRHTDAAQNELADAAGFFRGKADALIHSVTRAVQAEQHIDAACAAIRDHVLDSLKGQFDPAIAALQIRVDQGQARQQDLQESMDARFAAVLEQQVSANAALQGQLTETIERGHAQFAAGLRNTEQAQERIREEARAGVAAQNEQLERFEQDLRGGLARATQGQGEIAADLNRKIAEIQSAVLDESIAVARHQGLLLTLQEAHAMQANVARRQWASIGVGAGLAGLALIWQAVHYWA